MTKELKILLNFTSYILLGFLICLIGLSDVFAATYNSSQFTAQLYDNYGPNLSPVSTELVYGWSGKIPNMSANTSGAAWGVSSPISLLSNHTYTMTVSINGTYGGNIIFSTYNRIGVGTTLNNAVSSYQNNTNVNENYSKVLNNGNTIQFAFTPTINASYIVFPFATSSSGNNWEFILNDIIIEDLGSKSLTEDEINNSLSNQTNEINNSIQNSTDTIINNQNQNNEELKDTIKDNFNSCRDSYNLLYTPYTVDNKLTDTAIRDDYFSTLNYYVSLQAGKTYTFGVETDGNYGGQTGSDTVEIIFLKGPNFTYFIPMGSNPFTFIPQETGDYYIRYDINQNGKTHSFWNFQVVEGSSIKKWEQAGIEVCQNKIDETNDKIDETNQQLGDLNNNITNDHIDDNNVSNAFNQFENFIDENATISSLLTLPVTLFTAILNGMQNSCSPFNLGSLYGEDLILPCINISKYLGTTLWTMIDIIISGFAIYFISQKFIKVFNNFSSMKEGDVIDD